MPTRTSEDIAALHSDIEIDRANFFRNPGQIVRYRQYAAGEHVRILTDQQKLILENILDNEFCENVCHRIVAEAADRLSLQRFECEDPAVKDYLSDWYVKAKLDDLAGETHYNTLRDSNYALALSWDNNSQRVTVQREPWWDGDTGVFICYDTQDEPLYAVKEWNTLEGRRRVVWFEDRLERYISATGQGWEPHILDSDGSQWPQGWTKADGSPLHIPIIHFPNAGRGTAIYGTSELAGGVLGFQDQINDLQYDMTAAGRMTGFQMVFLSGVSNKDKQGNDIPMSIGPGQVFTATDANARGTAIPAGDITQLIALHGTKLKSVSQMTRTPLHVITGGDWPSGEALMRAEGPAVNKAHRQIAKFSDVWATLAHRSVEIANTFGKAGLDEDALVSALFASPERRDPLTKSAAIRNITDKISIREALRRMDYTTEEAEKIYAEMKQEKEDFGGALLSAFDKGQADGQTLAPAGEPSSITQQEKAIR